MLGRMASFRAPREGGERRQELEVSCGRVLVL